jgi:hypothetical protein
LEDYVIQRMDRESRILEIESFRGSAADVMLLTEQISTPGCKDASFLKDFFLFNDEISSKIE